MDFNCTNKLSTMPLLSTTEVLIFNIILPIISLIGFFINLVVVYVILSDRLTRQTSDSIYIVNLAFADMLILIIGIPLWLYQLNDKTAKNFSCQITTGGSFVTGAISILTLAAISYERYCNVTRPFAHRKFNAKKRSLLTILFIWLLAIFTSLPFFIGWKSSHYVTDEVLGYCVFTRVFRAEIFIFNFVTAVIVMTMNTIFYLKLLWVARYHARKIRQDLKSSMSVAQRFSAPLKREKTYKATCTLGVILGVMLVCWLPFLCISSIDILHNNNDSISVFTLKMIGSLTYMNSVLDPIVYTFMTRAFKVSFCKIIKKRRNTLETFCRGEISLKTIYN